MQLRALHSSDISSFTSIPDEITLRESPHRPRNKPPPILLIPSRSVLAEEMSRNKSLWAAFCSPSRWAEKGARLHRWAIAVAILLSFVIDDIRTAALPWQADIPIDVSLLLCILAFSLDISLRIMKLPDYLWSFYFYLDLLATAAVLADLQFLVSALFSPCTSGLLRGHKVVGRAARLGACAFRLLGYIRKRISGKRGNSLRLRTEDESLLVEGHVAQVRPENSALQGISGLTPNIKRESTNTPVRHNKKKHTLGRLYHLPNPSPAPPKPAKKAPASPKQSKIGKRLAKRVVTLVVLLVLAITLAYTWLLEVGEVREKYGREEYGLKLLLEARESRHFGEYFTSMWIKPCA